MNELGMAVVAARCLYDKRLFGMSFRQKKVGEWLLYWAFPLSESTNANEGYDKTQLNGVINFDVGYPGCPYCKSNGYVVCGNCHHITCMGNNHPPFVCGWCGLSGNVNMGEIRDLSGSADL